MLFEYMASILQDNDLTTMRASQYALDWICGWNVSKKCCK